MLDDQNVLKQNEVLKDLELAAKECQQTAFVVDIINPVHDFPEITNVVIAGMGGSALAGTLADTWLDADLKVPMEVVRTYDLPHYVSQNTLVIISSYSGNTEETVSCLNQARERHAQIATVASGGKVIDAAKTDATPYVILPAGHQPRMVLIATLKAIVAFLAEFNLLSIEKNNEITQLGDWLSQECQKWAPTIATEQNYAKQLAQKMVGKTVAFFGGTKSLPATYKMKICCNETAKNVAFWNEFPEFNHNEFMGWTSHPIEKPFTIFNVISSLEHPQILKRFEVTEKLLSGKKPAATNIVLAGDTLLAQLLWGAIFADFVSIYLASLNGADPMAVDLIEQLKKDLAA